MIARLKSFFGRLGLTGMALAGGALSTPLWACNPSTPDPTVYTGTLDFQDSLFSVAGKSATAIKSGNKYTMTFLREIPFPSVGIKIKPPTTTLTAAYKTAIGYTSSGTPPVAKLDWSNRDAIGFSVFNQAPATQINEICISITEGLTEIKGCAKVPGQQTVRLGFPLHVYKHLYGLGFKSPNQNFSPVITEKKQITRKGISEIRFSVKYPTNNVTLVVSELRFLEFISTQCLVDAFGRRNIASLHPRKFHNIDFPLDTMANIREAHAELSQGAPIPSPAVTLDSYGGCASCGTVPAPSPMASPHFRVGKVNGRWWFITPENHIFFSLGVNKVSYEGMDTLICEPNNDRRSLFVNTPSTCANSVVYNHYKNNLIDMGASNSFYVRDAQGNIMYDNNGKALTDRPIGLVPRVVTNAAGVATTVQVPWEQRTLERLKYWGFNTLGSWSSPKLFPGNHGAQIAQIQKLPKMPYTMTASRLRTFPRAAGVVGTPATLPFPGTQLSAPVFWVVKNGFYTPYPDVFSTTYEKYITHWQVADDNGTTIQGYFADPSLIAANKDPYCLGIFIDNETHWDGGGSENKFFVPKAGLNYFGSELRSRLITYMYYTLKYTTVKKLKTAWCLNPTTNLALPTSECFIPGADSDSLLSLIGSSTAMVLPLETQGKLKVDLETLLGFYANRYYSLIRKGLKTFAPNKLYLGDRYIHGAAPRVVVEMAADHVDVLSYNLYRYSNEIVPMNWPAIMKKRDGTPINKPILVGEFHWGSKENGAIRASGHNDVATMKERGTQYRNYLSAIQAALPANTAGVQSQFIGAHWFNLVDNSISGRLGDYEAYNTGLVDVLDLPYQDTIMGAGMRDSNNRIYQTMGGATPP